ncbi:MAG: flippase-like domain-containing protein [Deltaproteobacteria bacterium]|nr:flippase-like domain-containing protein [Deltaproteobacteria bacterium]
MNERDGTAVAATGPGRRSGAKLALNVAIGVASSALFTWLAVRDVSWDEARAALDAVRWPWVAAFVALGCAVQLLRMLRWTWQLRSLGDRRTGRSLSVGAAGLAAIFFLPVRLGEAARPLLIAHPGHVGLGQALATVVVERILDGVVVALLLLVVGLCVAGDVAEAGEILRAGGIVAGIFLGLGLALAVALQWSAAVSRLLDRLLARRPALAARLKGGLERFRAGIATLGRPRDAAVYVALTAAMWALNGLCILPLFAAFGLALPWSAAFVVLGAQAVGFLVPAAPTSVGPFHYAVVWALGLYGLPSAVAFNFAVVNHLGTIAVNLVIGLAGILGGGLARTAPGEADSGAAR